MTDSYHVLLPIGSEGPFSCDELRSRLASGKVRSSDRIMHALTRKVCVLTEILPEAGEASKARAPVSERIRRSNSDRHVAAQQSSQRLQAVSSALASTAALSQPPLPTPTPSSAGHPPLLTVPQPSEKTPRSPVLAITILIVVMLALAWIWRPSMGGGANKIQVSDLSGMWKSLPNANNTPMEITIRSDQGSLTITDAHGARSAKATVEFADAQVLVLRLMPTDPQFGQLLQFNRSAYGMTFGTMRGPPTPEGGSTLMVKTAALKPTATP